MGARRPVAALVSLAAVVLVLFGTATPASAHPLGNFTVNRYARAEVSAGAVRVSYVLDLAEIPAFQARDELADDPEGWADERIAGIVEDLVLEVDGERLALRPLDHRLSQPAGQGGLSTVRLAVLLEAELAEGDPEDVRTGRLVDRSDGDRIGWREIVVTAAGDAEIVASDAPTDDVSDALRSYPEGRLQSPLDVREATFRFTQGSDIVAVGAIDEATGDRLLGDRFTGLLDRQSLTPVVLAGMLAIAALVGMGHALAPGHGKTVMAAYLIGTRGRPVDAVLLGVIVSGMHTASVLVLGFALHRVDQSFALDRIYPVLTLVSGVGVLLVGAWLAGTRWRTLKGVGRSRRDDHTGGHAGDHDQHRAHENGHLTGSEHDQDHHHDHDGAPEQGRTGTGRNADVRHGRDHGVATSPSVVQAGPVATLVQEPEHDAHGYALVGQDDGHGHHHDGHDGHGHGHGKDHEGANDHGHGHHHGPGGHSHDLPEGVAPLSKRGLVLLATAGGIVPSPSAVIVLVSAFALGRVGLGLALVAAFSVGLAATLTAVGLALVFGSRALGDRVSHRFVRVFPVLGAAALLVLGLALTVQGVVGL